MQYDRLKHSLPRHVGGPSHIKLCRRYAVAPEKDSEIVNALNEDSYVQISSLLGRHCLDVLGIRKTRYFLFDTRISPKSLSGHNKAAS